MRALRVLAALSLLMLGGCNPPDFTSQLLRIEVTPATQSVAQGDSAQFEATGFYTTPPGAPQAELAQPLAAGDVTWSTSDPSKATIDGNGRVTTLEQGTVTIRAEKGSFVDTATLEIGAPRPVALVIEPGGATIGLGGAKAFQAFVRFSNAPNTNVLPPDDVAWTIDNTALATVSPAVGQQTVVRANDANMGAVVLSAETFVGAQRLQNSAQINIVDATLVSLLRLDPESATIGVGFSQAFNAIGLFSDGEENIIPADNLDWTSSDPALATVDANGVATAVAQGGPVTITGTLKPEVPTEDTAPESRTASAQLNISFASCGTALRATEGAVVSSDVNGLCLLCGVADEANLIDEDDTTFASINALLGLLGGTASIQAESPLVFDAGLDAGMIIEAPANGLLNLELLSAIGIQTLFNGAPTGDESSETNVLRLSLLGLLDVGSKQLALVSIPTTQPYNGIRLTFNAGVASALGNVDAFAACGNAIVSAEAPVEEPPAP